MSGEPEPIEPPPLWGEALFTRADGSAIIAQIKPSGEGVRVECAAALERDETLTDADGSAWRVAEVKLSADGGYSWATLALLQPPVNPIAPEPEAPPRPAPKKAADAAPDDFDDDASDESDD